MMTQTELDTQARQRAITERLHTFKLAGQPVYMVRSRTTEPGAMHCVEVARDGHVLGCSCKAWQYRQSCTHAAAVTRRLEREHRTQKGMQPPVPVEPVMDTPRRNRSQWLREED